jgi:carboxyl-terminal processing protease
VLADLEHYYYKKIDEQALKNDTVDQMVASLNDPYTTYLDPKDYSSFQQETTGKYSGVGMVVEMKNRLVTIVGVFDGSPASQAGIKPGDIIVAIDGASAAGMNLDQVTNAIKGAEGTKVGMSVYRPPADSTVQSTSSTASSTTSSAVSSTTQSTQVGGGSSGAITTTSNPVTSNLSQLPKGGATKDYTLTRKSIQIPVTKVTLMSAGTKKVALIEYSSFLEENSADALRAIVKKAVETDKVNAIILDLRGNGGGLLSEAVDVASIFIPKGTIVSTEGLHSPKEVYQATGDAYANIPLYVLTDPNTASASEVVSGALQDDHRALLVGERTFGKGLVQELKTLSNGGALKLTVAVYLTPKGRNINKTGLAPDVSAKDNPATKVDECVQAALRLIEQGVVAK